MSRGPGSLSKAHARTSAAAQAWREDYLELIEQGESREGIARRLGMTRRTLERRVYRNRLPMAAL